jgi:hypothetical protein
MKKLLLALALLAFYPDGWAHAQDVPGIGPGQVFIVTQTGANTAGASVTYTPPSSNRLTYVCGFEVSGTGATAATAAAVTLGALVGNITSNYTYGYALGAGVGNIPLAVSFNPCVPANAAGAIVTLSVGGAAGNTNDSITMWGYNQ